MHLSPERGEFTSQVVPFQGQKKFGSWAKNGGLRSVLSQNCCNARTLWRQPAAELPFLAHEPKIPQKIHFVPLRGAGFDRVGTAGMRMPTTRTMRGRANTRVGGGFRRIFGCSCGGLGHRVERCGHGVLPDLPNADPRFRGRRPPRAAGLLRQDRLDHLAGDVGQAEVAALEAVGQPLVVDAEQVRGSWRAGRGRGRRPRRRCSRVRRSRRG